MHANTVSVRTPAGFTALNQRLERASSVLREGSCLLQSIARRYYAVYALATYLAAKYGIKAHRRRDGESTTSDQFSHNDLPDVVYALYTGRRSGNVGPGRHCGVLGPILTDREAVVYAAKLQRDRIAADYGYTERVEPYAAAEADEHLSWANHLIADLRTLL